MYMKTTNKTGFMPNHKRLCRPTRLPEIPGDLISEILVRLPVRSLLRFKSVCRTWHATISGRSFISTHLQRSFSDHQRHPSFLISPDLQAKKEPNKIRLYRWQKGQDSARLVYTLDLQRDSAPVEVYMLGHCNGLVLVPTDTKMHVLNPSTRELLTLPESTRGMLSPSSIFRSIVGLGLDPSTNNYKVVRFFSYPSDLSRIGMEICTINETGRAWRSNVADPPYPISDYQTATFFQGSLFWTLDELILMPPPECRLLRFCLKDEVFSFVMHPPCPGLDDGDEFTLNVLDGELCLAQFDSSQRMVMWMTNDAVNPQWDRRYVLHIEPSLTIAISHHGLLLVDRHRVFQYDFQSQKTEDVARLDGLKYDGPGSSTIKYVRRCTCFVDVVPCIESLIAIDSAV
ncbi:F-box only protein 8-like [Lolium perenne]|uniref:F-box only protein 8-like n=1 Tax=Lolium perenne TaxID=4522 RepID=UPI0021F5F96B|nr:F-box only protein 8-like [Lolium perenne]